MNTCMYIHKVLPATAAKGYTHNRQPGKHIQLRQAVASSKAGGQAGTQKVREAMDGSETDCKADRQVDRQESSAGQRCGIPVSHQPALLMGSLTSCCSCLLPSDNCGFLWGLVNLFLGPISWSHLEDRHRYN